MLEATALPTELPPLSFYSIVAIDFCKSLTKERQQHLRQSWIGFLKFLHNRGRKFFSSKFNFDEFSMRNKQTEKMSFFSLRNKFFGENSIYSVTTGLERSGKFLPRENHENWKSIIWCKKHEMVRALGHGRGDFFANSLLFKIVSPQAAQLSIFFSENRLCCTFSRDAPLSDRVRERERREVKKAQHQMGLELMTSGFRGMRSTVVLHYNCCLGHGDWK